jgi:hypothetical protein
MAKNSAALMSAACSAGDGIRRRRSVAPPSGTPERHWSARHRTSGGSFARRSTGARRNRVVEFSNHIDYPKYRA